jgi:hypothetical protein
LLEKNLSGKRVAVGVQTVRGHSEDHVPGPYPRSIDHLPAIHDPDDTTGEIVFTASVHSGHLGRLPAD